MNRKKLIELVREIVSTEVEKLSGGATEVQKNQSGFGYLGKQSDAPKQDRKNEKHIFFNSEKPSSQEDSQGEESNSSSDTENS
jgi:hypothetical protein